MYVLLLDRLERQVLTEQQIAAAMVASGRFRDVPMPEFSDRQQALDAWVHEPLRQAGPVDLERAELLSALGM